jgi:hypothetical protein
VSGTGLLADDGGTAVLESKSPSAARGLGTATGSRGFVGAIEADGARGAAPMSDRVRAIASDFDGLSDEDAALIE